MSKRQREAVIFVEAGDKRKKRVKKAVELLRKDAALGSVEQKVTISTLTIAALDAELARLAERFPQLRAA